MNCTRVKTVSTVRIAGKGSAYLSEHLRQLGLLEQHKEVVNSLGPQHFLFRVIPNIVSVFTVRTCVRAQGHSEVSEVECSGVG